MNKKVEKIELKDTIIVGFVVEENDSSIKVCSTNGVEGFVDCFDIFKEDVVERLEIEDLLKC